MELSTHNKQDQLYLTVHSTHQNEAESTLGRLFFCYKDSIDCTKFDSNGGTPINYVLEKGNTKLAQLMFDYIKSRYKMENIKEIMNKPTKNAVKSFVFYVCCMCLLIG